MKKVICLVVLTALCLAVSGCDMNLFGSTRAQEGNHAYLEPNYDYTVPDETYTMIWNGETGTVYVPQITTPVYQEPPMQISALEYWIEYCDKMILSETDLYGMTQDECRLARNAIYAKSGRIFQSADLTNYFGQFSWYYPYVDPSDFTDSMLNSYQLHNLNLVIEYESRWSE